MTRTSFWEHLNGPNTLGAFIRTGGLMSVDWTQLLRNEKLAMAGGLAHVIKLASEGRGQSSIS